MSSTENFQVQVYSVFLSVRKHWTWRSTVVMTVSLWFSQEQEVAWVLNRRHRCNTYRHWWGKCSRCWFVPRSNPWAGSCIWGPTAPWASCICAHPASGIRTWARRTWRGRSGRCRSRWWCRRWGWCGWRSRPHGRRPSRWGPRRGASARPVWGPAPRWGRPAPSCAARSAASPAQTCAWVGMSCLCWRLVSGQCSWWHAAAAVVAALFAGRLLNCCWDETNQRLCTQPALQLLFWAVQVWFRA